MTALFNIPNTVLLAIAQVGVIVASAAGAMVSRRIAGNDAALPWLTILFAEGGVAMLLIPLVWTTSVLLVRRCPKVSDDLKTFAFITGIVLCVALALLGAIAFVRPFLVIQHLVPTGGEE
jgi:hypothetical protein